MNNATGVDAAVPAVHDGGWTRLVMAASYPVTMTLAMSVLLVLSSVGLHLTLASYAASGIAAVLVTWHEAKLPDRREWHPTAGEVRSDATFMAAFHMAMPYLLGLALTFWLVDWLEATDRSLSGLWPHSWPIVVQVVMMLLIVDFVRYWIHWSLHRFVPLWGFHAVHHSPHKLYWVNSARVHPVREAGPLRDRHRAVYPRRRVQGGTGRLLRAVGGHRLLPALQL